MAMKKSQSDCVGFACLSSEQVRKLGHKAGETLRQKMESEEEE